MIQNIYQRKGVNTQMEIKGEKAKQVIVSGENGEVLAVLTDDRIVEKSGVNVVIDWELT
jgi:predicted regulator of Ras-like GTPase activity (Roadblock/LC7/MglB family)